jgi:cytochrome c oxidase subunit 2
MQSHIPLFPDAASSFAQEVDALYAIWALISIFFSVLIAALVLYFMVRYRRRTPDEVGLPERPALWLEVGWSVVPLLIALAMAAWGAKLFLHMHLPPPNSVEYWVTGKQWMWKIQHPEGVREINSFHVPMGTPVKLTMTSEDVIHSFYVPAFRVKQDVLPGRYTSMWFTPTKPGVYHLFCAEYCGVEHSKMGGTVTVMTPEDYQTWLSGGVMSAQSITASGEQLFHSLACVTCHEAAPGRVQRGPSLAGVFGTQVALDSGSTVTADENYIRESILTPQAKVVAGYPRIMPTYASQVGEEQVAQLVAYVKSLAAAPAKGAAQPAGASPVATAASAAPAAPAASAPVSK